MMSFIGIEAIAEQGLSALPEALLLLVAALFCFQTFGPADRSVGPELEGFTRVRRWLWAQRGALAFVLLLVPVSALGWFLPGFGAVALSLLVILVIWIVFSIGSALLLRGFLRETILLLVYPLSALLLLAGDFSFIGYLEAWEFPIGNFTVSAWGIVAGVTTLILALWVGLGLSRIVEAKIRLTSMLSPSVQVLLAKIVRMILLLLAVVIAVSSMGIDLSALTIFGGAVGLGLGFGLQKIVSNLVCGFILLTDRSVKPGDVIEIGQTYGWINNLNARYVSVITRDGTEHLIPNEDLVTQKVVNWSFTNNLVRIRTPVGISYRCNPHQAIELIRHVTDKNPRVLKDPPPNVLVTGFGDSSIDLELRCWIADPVNGVGNIRSQLLLGIWDTFKENGIEIPFPQRDLHIRSDFRTEAPDKIS